MEITYLAHSSFKIKTKNGIIVTDPYDPQMVGVKYPKISADIVTISHKHGDHDKEELVSANGEKKMVVAGPGEYEISGISIFGVASYHDDKKGEERGKNTIYVIEAEDITIAHLGDLGHTLSEKTLESLGNVDVLMIPVGGEYTIGPAKAGEVARAIEPSIIIPMHYNLPSLNQETFGKLAPVDEFLKEMSIPVEESDKLVLKGAFSGEDQKVVKLQPANA